MMFIFAVMLKSYGCAMRCWFHNILKVSYQSCKFNMKGNIIMLNSQIQILWNVSQGTSRRTWYSPINITFILSGGLDLHRVAELLHQLEPLFLILATKNKCSYVNYQQITYHEPCRPAILHQNPDMVPLNLAIILQNPDIVYGHN